MPSSKVSLQGYWKKGGKVLARYDHWSDEPTLAWRIDTPWDDEADREAALSLDIAGDYVFLVIGSKSKTDDPLRRPIVFIYDKADGGLVGTMQPKPPVSDWAMVDHGRHPQRHHCYPMVGIACTAWMMPIVRI